MVSPPTGGPAVASLAKRPDGRRRAWYRDAPDKEHSRHFARKLDAQRWLDEVTASVVTGQYVDPKAGRVTFETVYAEWAASQVWEATPCWRWTWQPAAFPSRSSLRPSCAGLTSNSGSSK
jgi:hypothetical protein